jgi:hypothetical protein
MSVVGLQVGCAHAHEWAWVYRSRLGAEQHKKVSQQNKSSFYFSKEATPAFSQLLFSWNAFRPSNGHFTFYVQVRNAQKKTWGKWHKMADWGANVQRSYATKSDGVSSYAHVRLEVAPNVLADGFRVKVVSADGADIDLVQECAVSIANYAQFKSEKVQSVSRLASVHIDNVPKISQRLIDHSDKDRICSPASCTMLTRYLTQDHIDPIEFARNSYDSGLGVYGSWPFNMAHAFEQVDGQASFFTARLNSFTDIHEQLERGIPVVVSVRGPLPGATSQYKYGHLLLVVGWDAQKQQVLCHDPAYYSVKETFAQYPIKDFLRAWESSRRLAYMADVDDVR